jgi:poly-gamma-glutamate synthesis protein (capsule biosynthesis protein)
MSIWYKVSAICLLLIVFQFFFPIKGISSLSIVEGEFISRTSETVVAKTRSLKSEVYFFGDIMLARDVERTMRRIGADFPFSGFTIPSTSYAVANFESAIPAVHVPTPNNTFRFSTPDSSLDAIKAAGFTHLGLANNHTFDFGLAGYNHTVSKIWDAGLTPFGHPSVVAEPSYTVIEVDDQSVGVLAIHTLYSEPTLESLAAVFEVMKSESDIQIAYVHWGEEYTHNPSRAQRKFAEQLAKLGVDIIIGHHPHVVQSVEMIDETLVFYSLGNFIFDQYFSLPVQQGLVLKMSFGEENLLEIIPVSSVETRNQPKEMDAQNKVIFLEYLASISATELSPSILEGRISLASLLAFTPEVVIMTE